MRYLLDTHIVLWFAQNSPRLSSNAAQIILDTDNTICVSVVSAWEVAIKCSIEKLRLEGGVSEFFRMVSVNGFTLLPIARQHLEYLQSLPFCHRDPFDRLLVATAVVEGLTVITADEDIARYPVPLIR
ncbi:MAG: type II toxin-antitoxin system VapC family toxin [Coriobacteriales bacterium]|jgi:PIN domain nuclease of toxin-antitoxin system|nr:type II toxin-antitoxin system VapC family toxin [Coriobacteriales bacterium]